jgi:phosphoribosylglycinamide formyltransferase 1
VTLRLGVLVSGGGTNLGAILAAVASGQLDAEVRVVISNKPEAGGLERARAAGVEAVAIPHKSFPSREAFDAAVVESLRAHGVEWIVLAGFMRVVTPVLLDAFPRRVINIHPALLPAFPGVDGPGQALAYGVKIAGCTVHLVDAGVDTGPVIAQATVPVLEDDDRDRLAARILVEEHALLVRVLGWVSEGRVRVVESDQKRGRVVVDAPDR